MFSGDLLKRYFRYFILIVSIIIVVMGFLWLNFLYTRQERSLDELSLTIAKSMEEEAQFKARELRIRGEELRYQELLELEELMEKQAALLKASLYDIFYSHMDPEVRKQDISRVLRNVDVEGRLKIYVVSEDFSLGERPPLPTSYEKGISYFEDSIIFNDGAFNQEFEFFISARPKDFVHERLIDSFLAFSSWDESMYLKDERGELILPIEGRHLEDGFYFEEYSQLTGFTFGYFISASALDGEIASRRLLFRSFLESHIFEIIGFLIIFFITSYIIYRILIRQIENFFISINEEILDAFRNKKSLSNRPRFQNFALGDSFDLILRETRLRDEDYEKRIKELSGQLKKNKLDKLILKRRIERLSEIPYTQEILYNYRVEDFSPWEVIEEVHRKIDLDAPISLEGSRESIRSDVTLFSGFVEEIFNLTRDPLRKYSITIYRDGGQLLIYFTIGGPDSLDDDKMQELKDRAKLLDGVFLRHQSQADTLHLVLSLNDVRNEEK